MKVMDVCENYVAHAKNAPKELQKVIEDILALNGSLKSLDTVAKSARRIDGNSDQFDRWEIL